MPIKKETQSRPQFDILYQETRLEEERKQFYCGSARVDLDTISFDDAPTNQAHHSNVARLVSTFERAGCLRLDPQYHVPAVISQEQLNLAIRNAGSAPEALFHQDPARLPILVFPDDFRVQCLHGRHRIEAAKQYLSWNDRWWVVDFYASSEWAYGPCLLR